MEHCKVLTLLLTFVALTYASIALNFSDYTNHPCIRDCTQSDKQLVCEYNFTLEWYLTLGTACLNCPLNITDCNREYCIAANGVQRPVAVVNRHLPGPAIQVCENDEIIVNVYNNLKTSESTSIHWHGMHQRHTQHMDGIGMVTQCPILAHTSFQYKFYAKEPGTHHWHAHSAAQRSDGLFGALVIRSALEVHSGLYDYDLSEHIIILNDWLKETVISKLVLFVFENGTEDPDEILINGKGSNVDSNSINQTPKAVFTVKQSKRYRFRLINSGVQLCPFEISVDDHLLTVISSDGFPIQPIEVSSIIIMQGETYDFVLNANQPKSSYWIRIKGHHYCTKVKKYQTAILKYEESDIDVPIDVVNNYEISKPKMDGALLNPYRENIHDIGKRLPIWINDTKSALDNKVSKDFINSIQNADRKFYIAMDVNIVKDPEFYDEINFIEKNNVPRPHFAAQLNHITMMFPSSPLLSQWNDIPKETLCYHENIDEYCPKNKTELCKCIYVIEVKLNEVIEMIIIDEGVVEDYHPMHLHGYSFGVVAMGKINTTTSLEYIKHIDKTGQIERNLVDPPIKDVVVVPRGGYTIIRFVADNPGVWFLHCHLDFHSELGMGLFLKVGSDKELPKVPKDFPKCGNYGQNQKSNSDSLKFNLFTTIILINIYAAIINSI